MTELVVAWQALDDLPAAMDGLSERWQQITDHAEKWVAQRAGFEPSPVCLLRPLAELMDLLAAGFGAAGRVGTRDWEALNVAVRDTVADLRTVDGNAAGRFAGLVV